MLFDETIAKHKSDSLSILMWVNVLKVEITKTNPGNGNESKIKTSLLSKLDTFEADALSIANFYSDCEASLQDKNIMQELMAELQA